ncbi:MAG: hypothetical protein Q4C67_05605 [Deinococcus sp.]|nr:hypothetical protein [Deinococcus sp.]
MKLVRDVNKAREAGDRNGLIAAQRQLNLFRQQSTVHENVASFAESEVSRLDKAAKDRKESEAEATKTQQELDKQLSQGRIDLAEQELKKLEAQRTRDLRNAGDDAAAQLEVEQTLGQQIIENRKKIAAKVRDAALAEADKLTNEELKKQRKDKAQADYDLALDAAQDEYDERVANAQKVRDRAAETSSELRLSIARALTDGELDLAEQSAQGVIASYQMALEAAGNSAQEKARVQEEWAQRAADAEIAIAEVASRRRVLALQRERNRLINQEGVTQAERQALWKQFGDRIAAEEASLGQTVAGIQQKWGLQVSKAQEDASAEVKEVAKAYTELTAEVNRLIESGEWNAETQRDVATALALLDSTAEAAGVSLADLVVTEREAALGAVANADALQSFVRELQEAGATAEEVKAAVRGGTELQDALSGARGTLAANRDGQYDIDALRERGFELDSLIRRIDALQANPGTDPYIEGLLEKIPLLRDVLVPLLREVNDEIISLEDRRITATTAGKVATLTRDMNGLDRQVARGQRTPEEAIEERRRLGREIAELEWAERQRSEEFRKLTDEEEANERQAHQDRLLAIDQTYWDQKDELERNRRYAREDRVGESEVAELEWQHEQRLISTQAYLSRRDELLTEAAWREYARVVAANGDIEAAGLALDARLTEIARQGIRDREALDYGLTQYKELSASAEELVYRFEDGAISLSEFWTQATAAALRLDDLAASARAVGNTGLAEQFERDARTLRSALPALEAVAAEMRTLQLLAVTDGDANDRAAYLAGILGTEEYANRAADTLRQLADQLRSLQNQGDEGGAAQVAATIQLYKDGLPPIVQQTLQKKLLADVTDQLTASERELGLTTTQAQTPAEEWLMLLGDLVEAGLITAETYEEVRKRIQGVIDAQKELGKNKDWEKRVQDVAGLFNRTTPVGGGMAAALDGLAAWFGAGGQGGGSKAILSGAAALVGGLNGVFKTGSEETDQVVNTFVGGIQATLMKLASGDMLGAAVAGVATVVATIVDIFQGGVASAKKAKQEIEQATSSVKIFDVGKYASVQRRQGFWGWLGFKQAVIDQESVGIAQSLGDAISSAVSGGIMNGLRQGQSSFKVVGEAISTDFGAALLQTIIDTFIKSAVVQELLQPYLDAYVDAVKRKDAAGIQRAGADMQRAIVDVNGVIADAYENIFVPAAKELGVFGNDAGGQAGNAQQELFGTGPDALYGVPTIETTPSAEQKALISQATQVVADLGSAVSEWRAGNAELRAFIAGETGRPPAMSGNGGLV